MTMLGDLGEDIEAPKKNSRLSHLKKDERSPQLYRDVARILREIKSKKSSIKNALHTANLRRMVFRKVYALTFNVVKHLKIIDRVMEDTHLFVKEPGLNPEMAEIMIHELCIARKQLPGNSKPVLMIQKHKEVIEKSFEKLSSMQETSETEVFVPRYARVNTLVTTTAKVLKALEEKGFYQVSYESDISLDQYHDMVKQLQLYEFLIDFHFKDLVVFCKSQNLSALSVYAYGHIFLQDKSSYIPVHLLSPPPGSVVLDTCAAPGMKTVHIAACMNNTGIIYATDRDEKRFAVLKETLKYGGVEMCKSACCNFTDVDPHDEMFSSAEYILVDPSCSGTGMVSRMDYATDDEHSKLEDRFQKLAGFQITLLKHALSFPSAKRVVYSTCSVNEIENEYVVHEALEHYKYSYRIVSAFPEWPTRGQGEYEFADLCLRALPQSNLTNGFFVAVFERLQDVGIHHKKKSNKKYEVKMEVIKDQNKDSMESVGNQMPKKTKWEKKKSLQFGDEILHDEGGYATTEANEWNSSLDINLNEITMKQSGEEVVCEHLQNNRIDDEKDDMEKCKRKVKVHEHQNKDSMESVDNQMPKKHKHKKKRSRETGDGIMHDMNQCIAKERNDVNYSLKEFSNENLNELSHKEKESEIYKGLRISEIHQEKSSKKTRKRTAGLVEDQNEYITIESVGSQIPKKKKHKKKKSHEFCDETSCVTDKSTTDQMNEANSSLQEFPDKDHCEPTLQQTEEPLVVKKHKKKHKKKKQRNQNDL